MNVEVYRKWGRSVRYEHGVLVRVEESGEAIERGELFTAAPIDDRVPLPELDPDRVLQVVRSIEGIVQPERLVVSEGVAVHEYGEVRWSEEMRRVHLAIAAGEIRALLDLGDFELDEIREVAEALRRPCAATRPEGERVLVTPMVAAALLPSLLGTIAIEQAEGQRDGKGQAIGRHAGPPWPNWYRPSYRTRPMRMPFHLRAIPFGAIDRTAPRAVALLAPVERQTARVLCTDGRESWPATVGLRNIVAAGEPVRWYPYAAGSFGAEIML